MGEWLLSRRDGAIVAFGTKCLEKRHPKDPSRRARYDPAFINWRAFATVFVIPIIELARIPV
jgi:hypothetical protein